MPFFIVENDITAMEVDAIVNAANQSLLGGGGVDGAIHRAAGPQLLARCRTLGGCRTGQAKITPGYRRPARYVIHTVGPIWQGGGRGERELLVSAYRSSLELALANGCATVAFPLISSGAYGYPRDQALQVAVETIGEFVLDQDLTVYLVLFGPGACVPDSRLLADVTAFLDHRPLPREEDGREEGPAPSGEGFSRLLARKLRQRGLTAAQCARRANLSQEHFARLTEGLRPSPPVVLALAVALELSREEARELMGTAGWKGSPGGRQERIVEYFLAHGPCNIFEINLVLFAFGQSQLGG